MPTAKRPLSPHLQVYRLPLLAILSIVHRITGVALAIGTLLIVYWLAAAAAGEEAYRHAQTVLGSMLGQLLLFLWTWALFYHLCNGVRHLCWDMGYGFEVQTAEKTGRWTVAASIALTMVSWIVATA